MVLILFIAKAPGSNRSELNKRYIQQTKLNFHLIWLKLCISTTAMPFRRDCLIWCVSQFERVNQAENQWISKSMIMFTFETKWCNGLTVVTKEINKRQIQYVNRNESNQNEKAKLFLEHLSY